MDKELGVVFVYKQAGEQVVKQLETNLKSTTREATTATAAMERFAKAVERAGATEALGRPGGIMSGALGGGPGAIIGLGAVGGLVGLIAEADHMASSAAKLSSEILRNSDAVGMNAQSYQTWSRLTDLAGIGTDQLQRMLTHLNVQLETGAPLLKLAGTSLAQLGITTKDSGQAMLQLADYFHRTNDTAQQAAIAQGLFGRGAAGMIEILKQGSGAFLTYQKHLEDMGLLLTDTQLKQGALANTIHNEFSEALKGIELQVGVRLEAGFMQLWGVMTAVVGGGKNLFMQLGTIVGNVVSFIAGAIGQIFGVSQDQIRKSWEEVTHATAAYQGLGGAAQDATAPVDALGESTKKLDQALQQQITDLNEQQKAYDNVVAAQTRSIDAQIKELNLAQQQADAADAMTKAKETLAGDNAAIARDQAALEQDMFEGNVSKSQAANLTLEASRKKLADDTKTVARDEAKAQTQAAVDVLNDKKSALEEEKRQRDQVFQDAIGKLRDQVSANQQAQGAIQLANANTVTAGKSGLGDLTQFALSSDGKMAADWATKGADMVKGVQKWIDDIKKAMDQGGLPAVAHKLGEDIGNGIIAGIGAGMRAGAANAFQGLGEGVLKALGFEDQWGHIWGDANFGHPNPSTTQYGGTTVNPTSQGGATYAQGTNYVPDNQWAYLHRGEAVVPAQYNAAAGGSAGGGHTFNMSFNGVGPDVARVVRQAIAEAVNG